MSDKKIIRDDNYSGTISEPKDNIIKFGDDNLCIPNDKGYLPSDDTLEMKAGGTGKLSIGLLGKDTIILMYQGEDLLEIWKRNLAKLEQDWILSGGDECVVTEHDTVKRMLNQLEEVLIMKINER